MGRKSFWRRLFHTVSIIVAICLAVFIGYRLGDNALPVVIGCVFGVLAGLPTSMLLLLVLSRHKSTTSRHFYVVEEDLTQAEYQLLDR